MSGTVRAWFLRCLREPIAHFAAIGAVLFALETGRPAHSPADPERIEVSAQLLASLRADFQRRNGELPTAADEAALIETYVDDEVLYREALALGLDRGDPVVRRRLVQKMGFLTEDRVETPEPSPAELQDWLDRHADRYAAPERLTLTQVFLARHPGEPSASAEAAAAQLLEALRGGADPATLGDPFLLGQTAVSQTISALDARFGPGFGQAVAALPLGEWAGPVASSYGLHLVRVDARAPGGPARLEDVADAVRRDWLQERRAQANAEAIRALRARYTVIVDAPGTAGQGLPQGVLGSLP